MPGRGKHALSAIVTLGAALACGDPGDIEVPFAPGVSMRESLPAFPRVPARAFVNIDIGSGEGAAETGAAACTLRFSSSLGQPCALLETDNALCGSVRDGENATVTCAVRPLVEVPDNYDIDLTLQNEFLPELTVVGTLSTVRTNRASLRVTTPDGTLVDADCNAKSLTAQPGGARFRLSGCTIRIDAVEASDCDIGLVAGFEGCGG